MADGKYRLVFCGEVEEGSDITSIKRDLKSLLKAGDAKIEEMFSAGPITIKNNMDCETALKYQAVFEKTGARCTIEPLAETIPEPCQSPDVKSTTPKAAVKRLDVSLPPEFNAVKDRDEEILWVGKPNFTAFIMRGVPFLVIGLIWGSIDYFGFIRNAYIPLGFGIPFFALHLFPLWGGILNMVRLFLVHGNTCYAFTNKRLMMRSGFWGTDFKAIDYDKDYGH